MRRLAGVAAVVALVTACSGSPDGPPRSSGSPPRDRAGAPLILMPRDLGARAGDPCGTLLRADQLKDLGVTRPGLAGVDSIGAPTCKWVAAGAGSRTIEASVVQSGDLFVDTYRTKPLPIFLPHDVDGLPAVDSKVFRDDTACTTTVGVADGQTLDVDVARGTRSGERDVDACEISRRAAEEIVSTLPPL